VKLRYRAKRTNKPCEQTQANRQKHPEILEIDPRSENTLPLEKSNRNESEKEAAKFDSFMNFKKEMTKIMSLHDMIKTEF
jgi:hypothetical protein